MYGGIRFSFSYCLVFYVAVVFQVILFFQAEDGIRDIGVTGVQTCALPICSPINHDAPLEPVARRLPHREDLDPPPPRIHPAREGDDLGGPHVDSVAERLRHGPLLPSSPGAVSAAVRRTANHHPLLRAEVEDSRVGVLAHDPLQGPRLPGADIPGEDDAAALDGGLDAARPHLVYRVQPDAVALQYPCELHDLPQQILTQLNSLEVRSSRLREPGPVRRQDHPPPLNLSVQRRTAFLNVNRNYTGIPILGHHCILYPTVRLYLLLPRGAVAGQEARAVGDGVPGRGFGVHSGPYDLHARDGDGQVCGDEDDVGGSGGDGHRDDEGAEQVSDGRYLRPPGSSAVPRPPSRCLRRRG